MKPRQPFRLTKLETVANPTGSKTNGLGDAVKGTPPGIATTASTRAEDFTRCRQMP
jgi:hypothetical protein